MLSIWRSFFTTENKVYFYSILRFVNYFYLHCSIEVALVLASLIDDRVDFFGVLKLLLVLLACQCQLLDSLETLLFSRFLVFSVLKHYN